MSDPKGANFPSCDEFLTGVKKYREHDLTNDAMYNVAKEYVSEHWEDTSKLSAGVGVFVLNWNAPFYRGTTFSFDRLESCIRDNFDVISRFRRRKIETLTEKDSKSIEDLFDALNSALQIASGKKRIGEKTAVSPAKALHIMAPEFFPLWDSNIASRQGFYYDEKPATTYVQFCMFTKALEAKIKDCVEAIQLINSTGSKVATIKVIDEYNYSKFTL